MKYTLNTAVRQQYLANWKAHIWCRQYKIGSYFIRNYDQIETQFWSLNIEHSTLNAVNKHHINIIMKWNEDEKKKWKKKRVYLDREMSYCVAVGTAYDTSAYKCNKSNVSWRHNCSAQLSIYSNKMQDLNKMKMKMSLAFLLFSLFSLSLSLYLSLIVFYKRWWEQNVKQINGYTKISKTIQKSNQTKNKRIKEEITDNIDGSMGSLVLVHFIVSAFDSLDSNSMFYLFLYS